MTTIGETPQRPRGEDVGHLTRFDEPKTAPRKLRDRAPAAELARADRSAERDLRADATRERNCQQGSQPPRADLVSPPCPAPWRMRPQVDPSQRALRIAVQ